MLRIGIVVHGPEIIDSGCALSLINYLKKQKQASVAAVLGGTMGRVAVIDAGLEDIITIIAGDILARLGIPVIGIVDGEKAEIFRGEKRICIRAGDLVKRVRKLAGAQLIETEHIKSNFSGWRKAPGKIWLL